ncbi:unnamed protein product, partial [Haemonchus placei]|uniref:PDZ_6 domain-containing protein n=1 Tax=Haemonchus placei TaxID=6290 RepID=A0A0N4VXT5_HAEPC
YFWWRSWHRQRERCSLVADCTVLKLHLRRCFQITHIDVNSVLTNKIFVGDTIIALDGQPITSAEEIYQKLKGSSEVLAVKVRHGMWSWCEHRCTTLERIQMDKDTEKVTGRPIDVYYVSTASEYLLNYKKNTEGYIRSGIIDCAKIKKKRKIRHKKHTRVKNCTKMGG